MERIGSPHGVARPSWLGTGLLLALVHAASPGAIAGSGHQDKAEWYYLDIEGEKHGPVSAGRIQALVTTGKLPDNALTKTNTCMLCSLDAHCTYGLKKCNTTTGFCINCASDADCTKGAANTGMCYTSIGVCAKCTSDADCTASGLGTFCVANRCRACKNDTHCTKGTFNTGKCLAVVGRCYRCDTDADCSAFTPGTWSCYTYQPDAGPPP
jgi:hypothetical protein